jgi:hypothetical protein
MACFNPEFDGKLKRYACQCGYVSKEGERCTVMGESALNPESEKAKKHKIFCGGHAREDGRTARGRNKKLRHYVMTLSETDKKRARKDVTYFGGRKKKKIKSPAAERNKTVSAWLGSVRFEECNRYHTDLVLNELRIPPLLLGGRGWAAGEPPTRVYLFNSFALADLQYLYKRRADGRMLYLVGGSSIIR